MGRAFEYRKATKLKRWGHMARTFTKNRKTNHHSSTRGRTGTGKQSASTCYHRKREA